MSSPNLPRYEIEVVKADGSKALLDYTQRRDDLGIRQATRMHKTAFLAFLGFGWEGKPASRWFIKLRRGCPAFTHELPNGALVRFSGRTMREALDNPLPSLPEVGWIAASRMRGFEPDL